MIKKSMLLLVCLFVQTLVLGQKKYDELTKDDYLKDFDVLVDIIKNQHPNPYRFITEKKFDSSVKKLRAELASEPTYAKFLLSNPLPFIKDAHSGLTTDLLIFEDFSKTATFFPLSTIVFDNMVFVNQYNNSISAGAVIERVNGKTTAELLDNIRISADGCIDAINAKDFTLYVSLMYSGVSEYTIEYRESLMSEELKTITLPSVDYARSYYNSQKSILPIDLISYSYGIFGQQLNKQTYKLTIKSFGFSEEYAYHKLSNFFEELNEKGVKNLILDIRGNGGGLLSNIPLYYSFISREKMFKNNYRYATKVLDIKVRENLVDNNGRPISEMDIKNMDNFMYQRYDEVEGQDYYYGNNRLDESYVENYPRDRRAFEGDVYLLIDNNTVSAATYFAALFKENNRGVIVGQETRTCSNFTTASWFINYKLPNTQTIVDLPRSEVFFNDSIGQNKGCRGVIPDVETSLDQFYKGLNEVEDPEVSIVLDLIEQKSAI
ncbi:S41 family peptidase [Myroides pelagicus]|uniref:Peptidase S41 n=1 Tax=Myroides pelagicus TaxID=270914 RepID=A0A7K1GLQ0_9FLAO|nr:S41 family peptidase [Myroides pelagicus]MEC4113920.1 S41 family peptidase [Myroides pelagicus]MTH29154.1 peptidase S41 [Myroides pelagicus]